MSIRIASFEEACQVLGTPVVSQVGLTGCGWVELRGDDGELKDLGVFQNIITNYGDEYYAERATGVGSPPAQVTGMHLGTATTVTNKPAGTGLVIGTYISGSNRAIDGGFPSSNNVQSGTTACRIQWKTTWPAGTVTNATINEVVLVNKTIATDSAAVNTETMARAVFSSTINKTSSDSLAVTWNHDILGA